MHLIHLQIILDRILFIAFAEDKNLLPDNTLRQAFEMQNPSDGYQSHHNHNRQANRRNCL